MAQPDVVPTEAERGPGAVVCFSEAETAKIRDRLTTWQDVTRELALVREARAARAALHATLMEAARAHGVDLDTPDTGHWDFDAARCELRRIG